jgi:aspartyl-tRNA(Asn)/glutamyl-tRNA(Gln) amidotransferase subunit C
MTTAVNKQDLFAKIARLAYLELSSEELELYGKQISQILEHFSELEGATDNLDATWRGDVLGDALPERIDKVFQENMLEEVLKQAPESSGTAFQVPRILE